MKLEVLVGGLGYVESPRWHDDRLWLSDFDHGEVLTVTGERVTGRLPVSGTPSGLAFAGQVLLVASMRTGRVLRVGPDGATRTWADLNGVAVGLLNDMTADRHGNLFVGCFGYDLALREWPRPGPLLCVGPSGEVSVACPDVTFANGMAVTERDELLVAETPRRLITRFRIAGDGALRDRTVHADLGHRQADGLCLDAAGGVWFGSPFTGEFVRIDADGRVTHTVPTPGRWAVACVLGGPDGRTFYGLTAETDLRRYHLGQSHGRVECATAPYPRATEGERWMVNDGFRLDT
ncbi:gluconolaconase [Acrocarpospora pleiomorpha]|uniref:Gluconolaconase n=1 Tax=Acrocarpospora pleiomorpha TaxID=90975 RepID=A0A5M3XAU1_9ACTN|nr:SMP-30/gluconolactonase/LRE family protein [Acrocarpospora pleiomorpha]GES17319.1 gluconolaconase [Acrocarpospora pleiomorpha]